MPGHRNSTVQSSMEGCQPDLKYKIECNSQTQNQNQLKFWEQGARISEYRFKEYKHAWPEQNKNVPIIRQESPKSTLKEMYTCYNG